MIDLARVKRIWGDKPLAILGLGKSGMPVFAACGAAGIATTLWDDNADARTAAAASGADVRDITTLDLSGYAALCLAPGIPLTHPAPHPAVLHAQKNGIPVIGDIEIFHLARPDVRTIGITGTNGKSTTTALIGHILQEAHVLSAVGGNIGEAALTLPMLGDGATYILELSSYQLDLCATFAPTISILINISPDHLDRHGDMAGYTAAKERIFNGPGTAIIGLDDVMSRGVFDRVTVAGQRQTIGVSCETLVPNGVFIDKNGHLHDQGRFVFDLTQCPNLKGPHNWQNAGVAYAAARATGLDTTTIIKSLVSFPGLAHRQKNVATINGISYINDSKATNDQAAAMALRTFNPVYWIAGGKSKGSGYQDCQQHLHHVRHAFLIGQAEDEIAVWLETQNIPFTRCGTMEKAVDAAHRAAQHESLPHAVVLLSPACASFDQFKGFEHRGDVFTACVQNLERRATE